MYQLKDDSIIRLADNASIPKAEGNRDYREYLQWLEEGNTPLPMAEPAEPTEEEQYQQMIQQRNQLLAENDWTVLRHRDQLAMDVATTLTDDAYKETLVWRQQLRDMSSTLTDVARKEPMVLRAMPDAQAPRWSWPPIPPSIESDFPDYPPT